MRVLEKRLVTNQEAYLLLEAEKRAPLRDDSDESNEKETFDKWQSYLREMGLAGGPLAG